ncbi:MAG: DUF3108 domain-containing protein [Candidatus Scalindua sp.]|nr:DUF3108 domain-containing protein [Candidatus Scalindua sp.]
MTKASFFKVGFIVFLSVAVFHGRYSFSDIFEKQTALKSTTSSSLTEKGKKNSTRLKFEDEFLKYTISFWFLKRIGVVTLQCKREKNVFTITIDGFTTGLIDKIVHRHNIYRTTMVFDRETKRLKPLSSYEKKIKGHEERVKVTHYDYPKNVRKFTIWRNGAFRREKEIALDEVSNDDGITAFYNLRNESYGRVSDGAHFSIQTVHKERVTETKIHVRSIEDSEDFSRWKGGILDAELMAEITLDPEMIDSENGKIEVLLTRDFVPVGFVARDVVGFGDLYGILEQEGNMD